MSETYLREALAARGLTMGWFCTPENTPEVARFEKALKKQKIKGARAIYRG